jgi:MraZ protein
MKWETVEQDFIGRYTQVIDSKNRIVLPSEYRDILNNHYKTNKVYLMPSSLNNEFHYIRVLPPSSWHKITDELFEKNYLTQQINNLAPVIWDSVCETMDKIGRITLNQRLIKFAGITKSIVISGMKKWFQIWNEETFNNVYGKLGSIDLDKFLLGQKS